jgi:drug/metabolite transporter (DMT)-like permease
VSSGRAKLVGISLVLLNSLGISGKSVFIPLLYQAGLTSGEIVAGRLLYAIPGFWLIFLALGPRQDRRFPRPMEWVTILGLVAISAVPIITHTVAYAWISPALASTLVYIFPLFVVVLEWVFFRQKPDRILWVVILLVYAGIVMMLGGGGQPLNVSNWIGVALTLAAALAFSVYLVLQPRAYAPAGPLAMSPVGYCAWSSLLIPLVTVPFVSAQIHGLEFLVDRGTMSMFCAFGFLSTALPFVSLMVAVRLLGATWSAVLSMLTPALSVVLTAAVLHERLGAWQYGGVGLMILGLVALQAVKGKPPEEEPRLDVVDLISPERVPGTPKGREAKCSKA